MNDSKCNQTNLQVSMTQNLIHLQILLKAVNVKNIKIIFIKSTSEFGKKSVVYGTRQCRIR